MTEHCRGEPTEAEVSTFTVEITDSLSATREKTYRKRIGNGAQAGDVLIRKQGSIPIPGRQIEYRILVRNKTDATLTNVEVFEMLQGWFELTAANPAPTLIEPKPGDVYWTIPQLEPRALEIITYRVTLPNDFPLGVTVRGTACTKDECNDRRKECNRDADRVLLQPLFVISASSERTVPTARAV